MHIFRTAERIEESPALAWGFAILSFVLALAVRFWVDDVLPLGFPYITFFPAVILSAFFCGLWPGIACATASGLSAWYWFIAPSDSFALHLASFIALAFYVFIVVVDIALIHAMKSAFRDLKTAREAASGLYEHQRVMFQELQHRVANNMQFVASVLNLQKRQIANDPESAAQVVDEARTRLDTISRIHRRLYDPETIQQPVGAYFQELCGDIIEASGTRNVICHVTVPAITFELPKLMNLSLITTEIITNSLKHAFKERGGGTIRVRIDRLQDDNVALTISDDGPGRRSQDETATPRSLGLRIVDGLAAQLGGEVSYRSEGGMTARLVFPA